MAATKTRKIWNDLTFGLTVVCLVVSLYIATPVAAQPLVLFDNSHAQTAGNADWTISGGYSDMGDAAIFLGCRIKSHDKGPISDEALKGVNIFVTAEPNSKFIPREIAALNKFVDHGGSLFLISDHDGADRNRNGWDAVRVLNELKDFTGLLFKNLWFSEHPITGNTVEHQITEGVVAIGTWGGTSLEATGPDGQCLMFESHDGGYIAKSCVGKARIVGMGDSSPFDDGTGASGNKLYNGWGNPGFNHERLCLNSLRWLLKRDNCNDSDAKAFGKLLKNSSDKEVRTIQTKLEKAINLHGKIIKKAKGEVKATWKEDVAHLRRLKLIIESGDYSRTAIERLSRSISRFQILHPESR